MATSKSKEGGGNIRYDEFVKKVKPDVSNTEQVVLLHGYIGESGNDDQIRLYADASLAEYMDIAKADILHAVPNSDDPLGGSQLWVKQSSNVNYNDPTGFAQGDMYDDYMGNTYTPGDSNYAGAGAAATAFCPGPILTRRVICRQSIFVICTRNVRCFITPRNLRTLCRPCWVTPQTPVTPRTPVNPQTPVNPGAGGGGGFNDPYGGYGDYTGGEDLYGGYGDYTGGEMYNDYMANEYAPDAGGGYGEFAPPPSSPIICQRITIANCPSRWICPSRQIWRCPRTRWIICDPPGCRFFTRIPPISLRGCPSDFCTPRTPQTPVNPGAGGGGGFMNDPYAGGYDDYNGGDPNAGYGDYTSGEMYGDYLANEYAPEAGAAPAAAITIPPICLRPTNPLQGCRVSFQFICRTKFPPCYTNPAFPPCRTRFNFPPCRTNPAFPPCRITRHPITPCRLTIAVHICNPTRVCEINPGGGNFDAGYNDPYGYGY